MQQLQVQELQAFVAAHPDALLLDVREPWEVATARIALPGVCSLDIPMQAVPARLAELPAAQPVVCICHHGGRSAQVVAYLLRQGHTDVYNLAGGVHAWAMQVDPRVPVY
jgi:rhodanese-related sulfurtransferase